MKKNRRLCDHCGKRFLPRIPMQRFCAAACRQAWAALHDKRKNHKAGGVLSPFRPIRLPFPPPPPEPALAPDSEPNSMLDRLLAVLRFARDAGFDVVVRENVNGGIVAALELGRGR